MRSITTTSIIKHALTCDKVRILLSLGDSELRSTSTLILLLSCDSKLLTTTTIILLSLGDSELLSISHQL